MVLIMFWYCHSNLRQKPLVNRSGSPPMWDVCFSLKTVSFHWQWWFSKRLSGMQMLVAMHPPHMVFHWFYFDFGMYGYLLMSVYVVVQSILQYYLDRQLVLLTKICYTWKITSSHTVDGRNPADKLIGSFSHYLQGFLHPRWFAGFLNHQQ